MSKLKIELNQYHTLVYGKILYAAPELVSVGFEKVLYVCDGFTIRSMKNPELRTKSLHIHGENKSMDNAVFNYNYVDVKTATAAYDKIARCVTMLNTSNFESSKASPWIRHSVIG